MLFKDNFKEVGDDVVVNDSISDILNKESLRCGGLTDKTIKRYGSEIKKILKTFRTPDKVDTYNDYVMATFNNNKKRKSGNLSNFYRCLLLIAKKYLKREDYLKLTDELIKIRSEPTDYEPIIHDYDAALKLISYIESSKGQLMSLVMLYSGWRINDVFHIKTTDIVFNQDGLSVTLKTLAKRGKINRTIIYDPITIAMLQDYIGRSLQPTDYLFIDAYFKYKNSRRYVVKDPLDGTNHIVGEKFDGIMKFNYTHYLKEIYVANNSSGIKLTPHDFRRIYAAKVWEKTKDINVLKTSLNHASVETSMLYLRRTGKQVEQIQNDIFGPPV